MCLALRHTEMKRDQDKAEAFFVVVFFFKFAPTLFPVVWSVVSSASI